MRNTVSLFSNTAMCATSTRTLLRRRIFHSVFMNSAHRSASLTRPQAVQQARAMSREELELAIQLVCAALGAQGFAGIQSLSDVREVIDVLAHESRRREVLDAIAQTEVPFTRLHTSTK
jgi:hypothetical protein